MAVTWQKFALIKVIKFLECKGSPQQETWKIYLQYSRTQNLINSSIDSLTPISKDKNEKSFYNNEDYNNFYNIRNIENKLDLDIDYLWAGSTGGGSSLNMIFHNGVDDNEISKVENMLDDMVPLDTIADELNYSFETEEYHQTPIKVEE